jgi:hypothetical protein
MARKIILDTNYTFSPSTKTVTVTNRYIQQERLLLITNVTKNKVIYNFSDASLRATSYNTGMSGASGNTTIVLNYDTTTMSSTDKLQITVDEYSEAVRPNEEQLDPVGKTRTSQPQALIDTDFEYGTQTSKWENLTMINNRPFGYQTIPNISNLSSIILGTNSRTVTVNTSSPHYMTAGMPVTVQDTYLSIANGNFVVDTVPTVNSFSYTARSANTSSITSILDANKTAIYAGANYTSSAVGGTPTVTYSGQAVTVTTTIVHGLALGNEIAMTGITAANSATATVTAVAASTPATNFAQYTTSGAHGFSVGQNVTIAGSSVAGYNGTFTITSVPSTTTFAIENLTTGAATFTSGTAIANYAPVGSFAVATVTSPTQFIFYTQVPITGTLTTTGAILYVRPQGQFQHRAFDGGVIFSSNASSNYEQSIRQTRRYFRYQSGKGVQGSSGTIIKPSLQIDSLTSAGTTVTVQTKEQHNLQPGSFVTISGANESAYNGTFAVANITGYNSFTYVATSAPSASPASGSYYCNITSWYGAVNRLGLFDQQNGVFWEFDGTTLNAVRRSATFQLSGKVSVTNGSNTITQTNSFFPTNFSKQVTVGDWVVLRGFAYRVTDIASDTSMTVSPQYRGTTDNYVIASKVSELRIPQSQFNIDKLDGTGPSGYNIDLSKMQMWYLDYSWYGAGFIRWGVRATDGNIIYAHKLPNNNVNNEAYMRSGNIPARYESSTVPMFTYLTASTTGSDTTINVADTSKFPSAGTLVIRNNVVGHEYINYTGKTTTAFTGVTRGQAGNSSLAVTISAGSNQGSVSSAAGLQIGQRIIPTSAFNGAFPEGTFISNIVGTVITFSNAAIVANPTVIAAPMGATSGQSFTYGASSPTAVEFAYPTYAPTISHWGTSVIMDGRFDDDKSLVFTYGQQTPVTIPPASVTYISGQVSGTTASNTVTLSGSATTASITTGMVVSGTGITPGTYITSIVNSTNFTLSANPTTTLSGAYTITGNSTKALLSIRVAPSVDNGIGAGFGQRELINRMQLILKSLDISLLGSTTSNLLVRAFLNSNTFAGTQTVVGTANGTPIYLSTATGTGSVVTYTTTYPHGLNVGDSVVVSGVSSSTGYNGTYVITSVPTSTQFTVNSAYSTTYSTTGLPAVLGFKKWTNAAGDVYGILTSSLAQIADYAPNPTNGGASGAFGTVGGEVTGGYFANSTGSLDITNVRDLGNSVLGGGGIGTPSYSGGVGNNPGGIYPDGPDILTLVVTNLSSQPLQVLGRIGWTEAQA